MKTPIFAILRRIERLAPVHKQAHLRQLIAAEQGVLPNGRPNLNKTSVRIRELQAAVHNVMTRQLKRERRA